MYTGLVEEVGRIVAVTPETSGCRVVVEAPVTDLAVDDSVAVSGVCLTAEAVGDGWFEAYLSAETVERTYLASLRPGAAVNIERPLSADGRFDGHVVKGTTDTTTEVVAIEERGDNDDRLLTVAIPDGYEQYLVEKGAVAVDGISLTVADLTEETFTLAIIPQTNAKTTLSEKAVGDPVHFEADVLAKYVERQQTVGAT
ncbi:riboflavin synthase [Halomarina rubra]|uniref:Riboflavin synthase n=1 Tax=Halomarina rubra TaxID=2071873 RepID=A0ABD6AWD0_9EURY|nr:riboflavin synthase [Halomarina rubra]